jgi:hypothetical protein
VIRLQDNILSLKRQIAGTPRMRYILKIRKVILAENGTDWTSSLKKEIPP